MPFMQVKTYLTRNFATLGPLQLQPPFTGTYTKSKNTFRFHVTAPGRHQTLFFFLQITKSCVFNKQSPPPIFSCPKALFFPKLQSYFAEFLQHQLPNHLGAFTPTHLCQFKYGFFFKAFFKAKFFFIKTKNFIKKKSAVSI